MFAHDAIKYCTLYILHNTDMQSLNRGSLVHSSFTSDKASPQIRLPSARSQQPAAFSHLPSVIHPVSSQWLFPPSHPHASLTTHQLGPSVSISTPTSNHASLVHLSTHLLAASQCIPRVVLPDCLLACLLACNSTLAAHHFGVQKRSQTSQPWPCPRGPARSPFPLSPGTSYLHSRAPESV